MFSQLIFYILLLLSPDSYYIEAPHQVERLTSSSSGAYFPSLPPSVLDPPSGASSQLQVIPIVVTTTPSSMPEGSTTTISRGVVVNMTMHEAALSLVGVDIGVHDFWCALAVGRILELSGHSGPWSDSPMYLAQQVELVLEPMPGDLVFIELRAEGMQPTGQISHVAVLDHLEGDVVIVVEGNGSADSAEVINWGSWPVSQIVNYGRPVKPDP